MKSNIFLCSILAFVLTLYYYFDGKLSRIPVEIIAVVCILIIFILFVSDRDDNDTNHFPPFAL